MVEFNLIGLVPLSINIFLTFMLQKMKNIGPKRSMAISGWISFLIGLFILVSNGTINFLSTSFGLGLGIFVILAILVVMLPALWTKAYFSNFKDLILISTNVGIFIGYLIAIILAVIK